MTVSKLLARKVKHAHTPTPLDPVPAMRRAMRRAVDTDIGVDASIAEGTVGPAALLEQLEAITPNDLVVALERDGALVGAAVLNAAFWRAIVEQKTLGRVLSARDDARKPTGTDAALCKPILTRFMGELIAAAPDAYDWCVGVTLGARIELPRIIELSLPGDTVTSLLIGCRIGAEGQESTQRLFALPPKALETPETQTAPPGNWRDVAEQLPAVLDAVLHRMDLPLSLLDHIVPGQCIPLTGAGLDTLQLESADGVLAAKGRLGRMGAVRAVRIEPPAVPRMEEMGLGGGTEPPIPRIDALDGPGGPGDLAPPEDALAMGDVSDVPMAPLEKEPLDLGGSDLPEITLPDSGDPAPAGFPDLNLGGDGAEPTFDMPALDLSENAELPALDDLPAMDGLPALDDLPAMGELPDLGDLSGS